MSFIEPRGLITLNDLGWWYKSQLLQTYSWHHPWVYSVCHVL